MEDHGQGFCGPGAIHWLELRLCPQEEEKAGLMKSETVSDALAHFYLTQRDGNSHRTTEGRSARERDGTWPPAAAWADREGIVLSRVPDRARQT